MCPNGLGKSKTGINKTYLSRHVLETGPKTNTIDSWQSATLTVPDGTTGVIDRPPMAPPRKKRGSTLERGTSPPDSPPAHSPPPPPQPPQTLKVKNGFKDCFGPDSRRQSCDVPVGRAGKDMVDEGLQAKPSSFEIDAKNDAFSDFSKVPTRGELEKSGGTGKGSSKVGNRKSDKFFGENLSDSLSNEPVVKERRRSSKKGMEDLDKIDQFIESHVLKSEAKVGVGGDVPKIEVTKAEGKVGEGKVKKVDSVKSMKELDLDDQETQESLIKYLDESVGKETNLGKKAEFLMAMLEDYPEDKYLGMEPVEEPIIVPRKRKSRHICDDDNHMHGMLNKCEKESSKQLITTEASIETPPRKPSRDFSRYLANADGCSDSDDSCFSRPIRKQRSPSRKTLSSPPMPPKLTKSVSEAQIRKNLGEAASGTPKKDVEPGDAKAHTPRMLKRIISMPSNMVKAESRSTTPQPVLLKSSSSSSFLIKDLQRAHISVGSFTPEEHDHNAADELVKPKHRLAVRKISIKSTDGSQYTPTPTQETAPPKFTIGSCEVVRSATPPAVPKRRKSLKHQDSLIDPVSHKNPLIQEIIKYDLGSFLESSQILHHHDITNVIENVYNAADSKENILSEFQTYLEDHINEEINDANSQNPNSAKLLEMLRERATDEDDKLENVKIDLVSSENSNRSSDLDECFDSEFVKIEKTELQQQSKQDGSDSLVSTPEIDTEVEDTDKLGKMVHVTGGPVRMGRRESIEDVDSWFQHHNALSEGEKIIGVRKQRRGSDGFLSYDTTRQYPFGEVSHRRDSLSAELFEDITKLHDMGVSKDKSAVTSLKAGESRLRERRGSDGLVFYDTSRKFPFGEPNTELPKVLLAEEKRQTNGDDAAGSAGEAKTNEKNETEKKDDDSVGHSTLLKILSKENLI
uniref:Putative microtubule-associated protein futsch n=1 Tax=Culex tarsalis TaxID=7177 RepID=A0A1Q3FZ91_CULTA